MMSDANRLWQRERKRRYALWDLERQQPGSDQAIQYLAVLDEIERQDRDDPIGDAVSMSVEELRECVPETEIVEVSGSQSARCSTSQHIERGVKPWPDESHTSTVLSSRPIRSMTAFVSTLVLIISRGRFEPSPRTGVLIHSVAAATSSSNRVKAFSKTAINATKRSLSKELNRAAFALRAIVEGDTQIALEISPRCICRTLAIRSRISKGSPWSIRS